MKNISEKLKSVWSKSPKEMIILFLISVIIGLIFGANIGFLSLLGLMILAIGFVWLRQAYWYFTKTGDYEENDKKE